MLIVDAQVHVWAAHTPERPWPDDGFGREHSSPPLTPSVLLTRMDEIGIDRAILVPPSWEGDYNDLAIRAATDHPDRFAIMGRFDLGDSTNAARLPDWKTQTGMLGIRVSFLMPHQRQWLADQSIDWFWDAAERADIPLMILPPDQLPAIERVAERHPKLRMIIDHLAITSSRRDDEAFATLEDLYPLSRYANIAVKASGLSNYTNDSYPFRAIHGHIERVVDTFGPNRVFWGTDISRLRCSYSEALSYFTDELSFLSDADKELVMGKGICDWLGWSY
ncbi:MAG: amidohydrolase [Rhodospirillaceae bacterium]|jgi:L-fuconolactonase|nr:amidohydrolase [Rhodospirillaceae bacterium]MBT5666794.1 amidohydrolase [Rhodospirillaceae bacterium]MBT5811238.1 amidohydrolase [Rhodospirillaceae bacterium]